MWLYESSTGRLFDPEGTLTATGYAGGFCGTHPEGKNNPSMQAVHNIGPLPEGFYTLGQPLDKPNTGPYSIPLAPDPSNEMFDRSAFYIHGDTTPPGNASDGCIVMGRSVRQEMWESGDHGLKVIAVKG